MSAIGDILRLSRAFRAAALRRERAAAGEMVRRYGELWTRIRAEVVTLTRRYYEAVAAGEATSPAWLYQLERWQSLMVQIEREMAGFIQYVEPAIRAQQWQAVEAARRESMAMLYAALGTPPDPRIVVSFVSLPRSAFEALVGFTADGSPLNALLAELGRDAAEAVKHELITGVGMGLSPREVARNARKAFGGDLARALRVSRTETLRAYREAAHAHYEANSDIVEGWMWMSGNDSRTCAACLAMHGTIHPLSERLDDHPNGRCGAVPVTKSWQEIARDQGIDLGPVPETRITQPTGAELFAAMSDEEKLRLLGPAKFRAWQDGAFRFEDIAAQRQSAAWGSHRHERSLVDLVGAEKAAQYRKAA